MLNLYKKERTKEIKLNLENKYESIPYSSIALLAKQSDFKESFFDTFGNEQWENLVCEMFTLSITNLLITGKINVVYFSDKKSMLFNKIIFEIEGFSIYAANGFEVNEEDMLEHAILSVLQKIKHQEEENVSILIHHVVNQYIDADNVNRSEKKFFYEYLNRYAKKHNWLKITPNNSFYGLIKNYLIEIDDLKKSDLKKSNAAINSMKFQLGKKYLTFRNFIIYINEMVAKDFRARYPRD